MMRLLGAHEPTMSELVDATVLTMAPQYPELNDEHNRIRTIAVGEETTFLQTLRTGTTIFDTAVAELRAGGGTKLSGDAGVRPARHLRFPDRPHPRDGSRAGPLRRRGGVPPADAAAARARQGRRRVRARAAWSRPPPTATSCRPAARRPSPATPSSQTESVVIGIVQGRRDGSRCSRRRARGDRARPHAVLRGVRRAARRPRQSFAHRTVPPSMSTTCSLRCPDCSSIAARSPTASLSRHHGDQRDRCRAQAAAISRAHTATHMIHRAFRERLGDTATQMGSENAPGRLRFDFPNPTPVSSSVLQEVEQRVNEVLIDDLGRHRELDDPARGASHRRDGAVRREVRRQGPGRVGRRLGARAVRRHACPALGPTRRRHVLVRRLDRCRGPSRRGAGRRGRVPVPGSRAPSA